MRKFLFLITLFSFPFISFAGIVKGTITDSNGKGIPYVVVGVKKSTYGVNSNLAGGYFIELPPGNYVFVFSQIGLVEQERSVVIIDGKPLILNVQMETSLMELSTFEVKAIGNRDKGKEIMHHVIDARDDYSARVINYKCNTYQKSSLEKFVIRKKGDTIQTPVVVSNILPSPIKDSTNTKKRGKKGDNLDAVLKDQRLNLIESVTETHFLSPNTFKENILAYHDYSDKKSSFGQGASGSFDYGEHEIAPVQYSVENPYLFISDASSMDFDFYKNTISAPLLSVRPLLSPAAKTAFLNYKFDLLDSIEQNGTTVYKISVSPLFRSDALFSGLIFVQKNNWAIVSVNLCVNPDVLIYCKEFCVIIDYTEVDSAIFLPTRREFMYTIHEGKYNIVGNSRVEQSDYVVNGVIPPKTFTDEVKHFNDDAFNQDSAYWIAHRTISLDDKELTYIHEADSLNQYYESPAYLFRRDSIYNHLDVWSFLLNGFGHRSLAKGTRWGIDPLINQFILYGPGGYRHRLAGDFDKDFKDGMLLETDGEISYGFLNEDIRAKVGVGLTYYPLKFVRTFVRFGDTYEMVNNYASISSAFSRSNYVREQMLSVSQRMEIINGLYGELTFQYKDQSPIAGLKDAIWRNELFGNLNTPIEFQEYINTEIKLELKYRFRQKYIIKKNKKIIVGTKYPEIRFFYRKGIPSLFKSEVNFDYIEFSSVDEFKFARFGKSNWSVKAGAFINKKDLRVLEYKYFRGSDGFIFSDPLNSFQLLGPSLNTPNAYFRLNYIHHFEGFFGSKIPLYRNLKITSAVGGGGLIIPNSKFYHQEFFVGLERIIRIKKQLFRVGIFAVTADNNISTAAITYKVGISFFNSFSGKWSY